MHYSTYTDDTVIVTAKNVGLDCKGIKAIKRVYNWINNNKLSFNTQKINDISSSLNISGQPEFKTLSMKNISKLLVIHMILDTWI